MRRRTEPSPSGTTSIRSGRTPSSSTRSSRVLWESAITRCERRAAAGTSTRMPLSRHARVRVGEARVDEVVHRHHATEAAPRRGRCWPGCASARPRPAPPAARSSACSPSTHCTRLRARTGTVTAGTSSPHGPPPAPAVSRLTNAVKRVSGGRLRDQPGQQLARRDLHAAGLAGDEEDQVEAYVHGPREASLPDDLLALRRPAGHPPTRRASTTAGDHATCTDPSRSASTRARRPRCLPGRGRVVRELLRALAALPRPSPLRALRARRVARGGAGRAASAGV